MKLISLMEKHIVIEKEDVLKYLPERQRQNLEEILEIIAKEKMHRKISKPFPYYYVCDSKEPYAELIKGIIEKGEEIERGNIEKIYTCETLTYQLRLSKLTDEMYHKKRDIYAVTMLYFRMKELIERGGYSISVGEATKRGTIVTFATVRSKVKYKMCWDEIIEKGKELHIDFSPAHRFPVGDK